MHRALRQLAATIRRIRTPPKTVIWGQQSWDEMMVGFFNLVFDASDVSQRFAAAKRKLTANSKAPIAEQMSSPKAER